MRLLHHSRGWPAEIMVSAEHRAQAERIAGALRAANPSDRPAPTVHERFAGGELLSAHPTGKHGGRSSIQDALVFVGQDADGQTCLKIHPDHVQDWPPSEGQTWSYEELAWHLDGGDVMVLDGMVLVGHSSSQSERMLPDRMFGKRFQRLKSRYPIQAQVLESASIAEAWNAILKTDSLPLPFVHLDLFLTAIEEDSRVVFFLAYLVRDRLFDGASPSDQAAFHALYRCLEGMVVPLEGLAHALGKSVEIRRLPFHVGQCLEHGISFCNGVLAHHMGQGALTVMVPDSGSEAQAFTRKDFEHSRQVAQRALDPFGIRLYCVESQDLSISWPKRGMAAQAKVLVRHG